MSALRKVGKHGAVVIPVELRDQFGLHAGALVAAEATGEGILLRPVRLSPDDERFMDETERAYATLKEDAAAWEQELAERRVLEGTLLDGLEAVDEAWLAGWLAEDGANSVVAER